MDKINVQGKDNNVLIGKSANVSALTVKGEENRVYIKQKTKIDNITNSGKTTDLIVGIGVVVGDLKSTGKNADITIYRTADVNNLTASGTKTSVDTRMKTKVGTFNLLSKNADVEIKGSLIDSLVVKSSSTKINIPDAETIVNSIDVLKSKAQVSVRSIADIKVNVNAAKANLIIEGNGEKSDNTDNNIQINIGEKGTATKISTNVPIAIDSNANDVNVVLGEGAADSLITSAEKVEVVNKTGAQVSVEINGKEQTIEPVSNPSNPQNPKTVDDKEKKADQIITETPTIAPSAVPPTTAPSTPSTPSPTDIPTPTPTGIPTPSPTDIPKPTPTDKPTGRELTVPLITEADPKFATGYPKVKVLETKPNSRQMLVQVTYKLAEGVSEAEIFTQYFMHLEGSYTKEAKDVLDGVTVVDYADFSSITERIGNCQGVGYCKITGNNEYEFTFSELGNVYSHSELVVMSVVQTEGYTSSSTTVNCENMNMLINDSATSSGIPPVMYRALANNNYTKISVESSNCKVASGASLEGFTIRDSDNKVIEGVTVTAIEPKQSVETFLSESCFIREYICFTVDGLTSEMVEHGAKLYYDAEKDGDTKSIEAVNGGKVVESHSVPIYMPGLDVLSVMIDDAGSIRIPIGCAFVGDMNNVALVIGEKKIPLIKFTIDNFGVTYYDREPERCIYREYIVPGSGSAITYDTNNVYFEVTGDRVFSYVMEKLKVGTKFKIDGAKIQDIVAPDIVSAEWKDSARSGIIIHTNSYVKLMDILGCNLVINVNGTDYRMRGAIDNEFIDEGEALSKGYFIRASSFAHIPIPDGAKVTIKYDEIRYINDTWKGVIRNLFGVGPKSNTPVIVK